MLFPPLFATTLTARRHSGGGGGGEIQNTATRSAGSQGIDEKPQRNSCKTFGRYPTVRSFSLDPCRTISLPCSCYWRTSPLSRRATSPSTYLRFETSEAKQNQPFVAAASFFRNRTPPFCLCSRCPKSIGIPDRHVRSTLSLIGILQAERQQWPAGRPARG